MVSHQVPVGRAAPPPRPKHLRLVVIEDNPDTAESLRMLLEICGHEVIVAYTGTEGVKAVLHHPPDVVLCDIGLPDLSGWEVARSLRRHLAPVTTQLIALTAYSSAEDQRLSQAAG